MGYQGPGPRTLLIAIFISSAAGMFALGFSWGRAHRLTRAGRGLVFNAAIFIPAVLTQAYVLAYGAITPTGVILAVIVIVLALLGLAASTLGLIQARTAA